MRQIDGAWKLSPSDFAFLWEECKRCFWKKYRLDELRPSTPFPKIFTKIDLQMKAYYAGRATADISTSLPAGSVFGGDVWVRSAPLFLPTHNQPCCLVGRIDTVLKFDSGEFGIIDFKTSSPKDPHVELYGRQLHAYAWACESPASGRAWMSPVSALGLLAVEPVEMIGLGQHVAYRAVPTWIPVVRNDDGFRTFLGEVLNVLESGTPPAAGNTCGFCRKAA